MSEEVMKLARNLADADQWVTTLSAMNRPYKTEDRVKADAAYLLAVAAANKARSDYNNAVSSLDVDELTALSHLSLPEPPQLPPSPPRDLSVSEPTFFERLFGVR